MIFDLKTTGFRPHQGDEILSIGAVRVQGGIAGKEGRFHTLVQPVRPVPEEITLLTGITQEEASRAPEPADALERWLNYIGQSTLVAYGAGHDAAFIREALRKTWKSRLTHRIPDGWQIARCLHPDWPDHSLDSALQQYGIPIQNRHTADGDAWMTALLWERMLNVCRERSIHSLDQLYSALNQIRY
ncbi:exonuclease domain-containing protein [Melghirimyces profundicolus]|uniref:exonuclease domain-containing protein n=1 Tax=Melghirimyces profundicolus TaxID=1242148 RepID=UPI0014749B03|nr:exonuclease domain-containing protein [Melghirimyces profundicolus]